MGRKVLTAHLEDGACGWFVGTVFSSSVGVSYKKGKKGVPTATHVVEYKEKETRTNQGAGWQGGDRVLAQELRPRGVVAAPRAHLGSWRQLRSGVRELAGPGGQRAIECSGAQASDVCYHL